MSSAKNYPTPPVAWLLITQYTHQWLFREFGGAVRLHGYPVLSVASVPEAREILRMQTQEDILQPMPFRWSLSAMRMDCMQLGIGIGPKSIEEIYGLTAEGLKSFVPIECPKMALTEYGVLRPWNRATAFGQSQAYLLCKLLRSLFWQAVANHQDKMVAEDNAPETAIELAESFCAETGTPDIYADDIRREWQRQCATKKARGGK